MIALRFVRLIESHSDQLAESLLHKLETSPRTAELHRIPPHELRERIYEVYRNLSQWLLDKTVEDIDRVYTELGRRRSEQGVPLGTFCWALMMTRENLWDFLEVQGIRENPIQMLGGFELLRLLEQFFDRAVYYSIQGYEAHRSQKEVESTVTLFRA